MEHAIKVQVLDRQNDVADRNLFLGEHLGDFPAHHHADDVITRHIGGSVSADIFAVAENRELVGDLEQLVHLMGDVDDADAALPEITNDAEEMLDLALRQRRCRLVHDENVGIVGNRLGDLDHLTACHRKLTNTGFRIEIDTQPLKQGLGAAIHFAVINEAQPVFRLAADPDVFRNRHVSHQVQFLMDHGDAVLQRIERGIETDRRAFQANFAVVRLVDAGENLHQRRFAGAILAHQRMHGAALEVELHIIERHDAGKFLAYAIRCEKKLRIRHGSAGAHGGHCRWTDDHLTLHNRQK
ncbi:hypothetical protein D3C86_1175570 [compost metagenome]